MNFDKKEMGHKALLELLLSRGLIIQDTSLAYSLLAKVGYYRLSGYFLHFQTDNKHSRTPHKFNENTSLENVAALYDFESSLRSVVSAALERLEIALRTGICEFMCSKYGAHWYMNAASFEVGKFQGMLDEAAKHVDFDLAANRPFKQDAVANQKRSRQLFIDHYYQHYTTPKMPPAWMLREQATFGFWARTYDALKPGDQKQVGQLWRHPDRSKIDAELLGSWLWSISILRNRCSHHTRITTRNFPFPPQLPQKNKSKELFLSKTDDLRTLMAIIFILTNSIDANYDFRGTLKSLFIKFPTVNIEKATGFSLEGKDLWAETTFWKWSHD